MRWPVIFVTLVVASCGGSNNNVDADAGPNADAASGSDGAQQCAIPSSAPSWLEQAQDDDLRRLTGMAPTPAGAMLPERSTSGNRTATRVFLQARFAELGYDALLDSYGSGINVYAELEATNPTNSTIVIGAHFDTVPGSPGANDNATGVAMVLAAARYAREVDCRSHNLLFTLFDQEEIGLVGSDAFAQLLSRVDFEANVVAVHTIDQMGWDQDGDRGFEMERPDGDLITGYQRAKTRLGAAMPIHQTTTGFTDHVSFRPYGFQAIGVTEEYVNGDTTPHYHLDSDTYDTVNRDYLASTTTVLLEMLGHTLSDVGSSARRTEPRPDLHTRYKEASISPRVVTPRPAHGCRGTTHVKE